MTSLSTAASPLPADSAHFELLMRQHNQLAFRAARSVLKDDAEAEETVQQAWLHVWEHLSEFRGGAQFSTWLVRIVINEALMRTRRAGRVVALDDEAPEESMDAAPTPQQLVENRELGRLLESAVDQLPEGFRTVYMLREVEGFSTADTASALGVEEDVVKTRLHRARRQLRDLLMRAAGERATEVFTFGHWRCDRVVAHVLAAIGAAPRA